MGEYLIVSNISFKYGNSPELLFDSISLNLHKGWTGIAGPNGSGKTTLLKLLSGILQPLSGSISKVPSSLYCEQRTDEMPEEFPDLIYQYTKEALTIRDSLGIRDEWLYRWDTLSHGERKRCQIASALLYNPIILAVDEPSNHLDHESRIILLDALKMYNGIGLLVSHDRELLDSLCSHTVFIGDGSAELRKCAYSVAYLEKQRENENNIRLFEQAGKEAGKLKKKAAVQKVKADMADRNRSKRNISPKDHDAKAKIDGARLTGKDALDGRQYSRIRKQLERVEGLQNSVSFTRSRQMGIVVENGVYRRYFPLNIDRGELNTGSARLIIPDLRIETGQKIGIAGKNGSGKSTFLKMLAAAMKMPAEGLLYIPQEISLEESRLMLEKIQARNSADKGRIMTIVSRLGSDPTHLFDTLEPSPGEVRKLKLAEGLLSAPGIIIMDEPTNHMDLPSVECLEDALAECGCAMLLVSHDLVFLRNLVSCFWSFEETDNSEFTIKVKDAL